MEEWEKSVAKKAAAVKQQVATTCTEIEDAIAALWVQKHALEDGVCLHADAWEARNAVIRETYAAKITCLKEHCEKLATANPVPMVASGESEVVELQHALANAKQMIASLQETMNAADVRYQLMEATMAAHKDMSTQEGQTAGLAASSGLQEGKDSLMQSQMTLMLALGKGETEGAAGVLQVSDKGKGKGHDQY
jgi:hypothetical protein